MLATLQRLLPERPITLRIVYFACGALLTLSFAPFGLWWLAPFLLMPMLLTGLFATPRIAAWLGFSFGAGLFLFGTYWLYISIHVFGQAPLLLAVFLMLALVLIMAAWFALCGWLLARLVAGRPWRLVIYGPFVWVLIEWLRGWVASGFPWMSLGYGQIDSPLAGWLPVAGVYGVSLMVAVSAAALVVATFPRARYAAAGIAIAPWLAGAALASLSFTEAEGPPQTVTLVQGGVSQDRKWLPQQFQPTLRLYRNSLLAAADSDIVVWPEVAVPSVDYLVKPYIDQLQLDLKPDQALLFGILERAAGSDDERIYNSVLMLDGERQQVYRKRHLVPFGEYFPVPDFVREWMRLMSLPNSDLAAGSERQPLLETAAGTLLAVAICYEDAYGAEQLYALPEAGLLINVSNDAWFGDSIAPHQHLEIARVRAREAERYVLRATNNGISAIIAPDGGLLETAPQFEYATLSAAVTPLRGATPYARAGNWPVILLAFAVIGFGLLRLRRIRL